MASFSLTGKIGAPPRRAAMLKIALIILFLILYMQRPYAVAPYRVARARPFKTVADVRAALRAVRAGESVGFSRKASLVAMGLLPRADGLFRVSEKYR